MKKEQNLSNEQNTHKKKEDQTRLKISLSYTSTARLNKIIKQDQIKEYDKSFYLGALYHDTNRIVSSSAFRRLQDKAQVYPLEKYDFVRTRLTHSSEVAALAEALGKIIYGKLSKDKLLVSPSNVNVYVEIDKITKALYNCGLLHDIGNPPFGHYGEDIIKNYFKEKWSSLKASFHGEKVNINTYIKTDEQMYCDFARFDGNAQALRVVTKLQSFNSKYGLDLTSIVLGGLIKYPFPSNSKESSVDCKFGYFYSETDVINGLKSNNVYLDGKVNPIALIMEAADDIACIVSDFEDAVKKGNVTYEDIEKGTYKGSFITNLREYYKINERKSHKREALMTTVNRSCSDLKNQMMYAVQKYLIHNHLVLDYSIEQDNSRINLLEESTENDNRIDIKEFLKKYVYNAKEIVNAELEGDRILTYLLDTYTNAILAVKLSSHECLEKAKSKEEKLIQSISRNYIECYMESIKALKGLDEFDYNKHIIYYKLKLVTDHICGMTDSYAKEMYKILNGMN